MSSNAPLRAVIGTSSARRTEALTAEVVTDPPAKPAASNSYSKPSAAKNPCSSATHSCNRTCGWIRTFVIRLLLDDGSTRRQQHGEGEADAVISRLLPQRTQPMVALLAQCVGPLLPLLGGNVSPPP